MLKFSHANLYIHLHLAQELHPRDALLAEVEPGQDFKQVLSVISGLQQ